jgi:hypothetical protein
MSDENVALEVLQTKLDARRTVVEVGQSLWTNYTRPTVQHFMIFDSNVIIKSESTKYMEIVVLILFLSLFRCVRVPTSSPSTRRAGM